MQCQQLERFSCYSQKALHRYFVRSHDRNLDEVASVYWLTQGDLSLETEGFILATQDQALNKRASQTVFTYSSTPQCQLCNSQPQTVDHLISGCTQLAGTEYTIK